MAVHINITVDHPIQKGEYITFISPCASSDFSGTINVTAPTGNEGEADATTAFTLKDAAGTAIASKSGVFAANYFLTVIIDPESTIAHLLNAATAYAADMETALGNKMDKTGDAANAKIGSSTESTASYPVPAANDTFKVILGKIVKFFTDIKAAFVDASVSGTTITLTKANGSTKEITTQDTTYSGATYNASGLMNAQNYRRITNTSSEDGSVVSANAWYAYMTDSSGNPGWRNNGATYEHPGLFGASQYRALWNFESDGTRTNTQRCFWGTTVAGEPGMKPFANFLATATYPGFMSSDDKTKLGGIAAGATVSGVIDIQAGTKSSLASSTSTITTVASKAVSTAGTYLVMMTASTASSASSGYLRGVVNTSAAWGEAPSNTNMNGTGACVSSFYVYTISSSTTFRALVQQSSGTAQDVRWNFAVIRIA